MVLYTLGEQYRGSAKREVRSLVENGKFGPRRGLHRPRRRQTDWTKWLEGCLVCNRDQMPKKQNYLEEVTKAINKLKRKQEKSFLLGTDLYFIGKMFDGEKDGGEYQREKTGRTAWATKEAWVLKMLAIIARARIDLKKAQVRYKRNFDGRSDARTRILEKEI